MEIYKRILVPIDFSKESVHAARRALEIAPPDGRVTLLHVNHNPIPAVPPPGPSVPTAILDVPSDQQMLRELDKMAERMHSINPAVILETEVVTGLPGRTIVEASSNYDLIIMTPKEQGRLRRFILGSVADETVRNAECPVLIERR